jgi:hypothetical protein
MSRGRWTYAECPHGSARHLCRKCDKPLASPRLPVKAPRLRQVQVVASVRWPVTQVRSGYVPPAGSIALELLGRDRAKA